MISSVKNRIYPVLILISVFTGIFLYYKFFTKTNPEVTQKISNQVEYVDGDVNFKPEHTKEQLVRIVSQLRSGEIDANTLNEITVWELVSHIGHYEKLESTNKQDIRMLHELAKVYRTTQMGQQLFKQDLTDLGSEPASPETTKYIHNLLKEKGCPVWDIPIYKLINNKETITGICSTHGIWINEKTAKKIDMAHESGHWFFQHNVRELMDHNLSITQEEYEADNFAYDELSTEERKNVTKALLGLDPNRQITMPEPYYSNWLRIAKEHGEYPTIAA